jgi:hypothetical protein
MAPSARFRAPTCGERTAGGTEIQVVYNSPSFTAPLDSALPRSWNGAWVKAFVKCRENMDYAVPAAAQLGGGQIEQSRSGTERPFTASILFFACFFSGALTCKRSLHTLLFAGLQVKGVTLDLLNDVFLLHLALEAAESILEGFPLLKSYFCQNLYTPRLVLLDRIVITSI